MTMEFEHTSYNAEREALTTVESLRAQVEQLEQAIEWLRRERANWEQAAHDHHATIVELHEHLEQQRQSLLWVEEQRARWETAARANEEIIVELQAQLRRLEEFVSRMTSTGPQPR